jgi:hypothetical protein
MTCDDVDGGGVKRLVGVPVGRCRRCDVDVGAVLLGTNKARQKLKSEHTLQFPKIWGTKDSQKLSKFVSRERRILCQSVNWMSKRGYYGVKTMSKVSVKTV